MKTVKLKDTLTGIVLSADPRLVDVSDVDLYNTAVTYLFRGYNYRSLGSRLTKLAGFRPNVRAITEQLAASGYVIKNYKLWLFYVVKNKLDQKEGLAIGTKWGVNRADMLAFRHIDRTALAQLRRLAVKYPALTLEAFDKHTVSILHGIKRWNAMFTNKKLRFIATSQNIAMTDLQSDLACYGIQGLMNMYPCVDSKLHAINIVKRVMHNQGINMIHHYTSQKIGRLLKDEKGAFSARVVGLDDIQMNYLEYDTGNVDLRADVGRVFSRYTGRKLRFLELLAGAYCDEFTNWLATNGHKVSTNESLHEKLKKDSYIKLCLDFLNVSVEKGMRFVEQLREQFAPYKQQGAMA
jgi:hypothetical protein